MKTEFHDHRETSEQPLRAWTPETALEKSRDTIKSQEDFLKRFNQRLAESQTRDREIKRRFEAEHAATRREMPIKDLLEARHNATQDRKADEARSFYAHGYKEPEDQNAQSEGEDEYSSEGEYTDKLPSHLSMRRGARLEGVIEPGRRNRKIPMERRKSPTDVSEGEYKIRLGDLSAEYSRNGQDLQRAFKEGRLNYRHFSEGREQLQRSYKDRENEIMQEKSRLAIDEKLAQEAAYRASRENARTRGRYPAHQPIEWHREERRKEAEWQDHAFDSVIDEDVALQDQYDLRQYGLRGEAAWDQGESPEQALARERAERRAEFQMRLDALDEELDRVANQDDAAARRVKNDGLEQKKYRRPRPETKKDKQGVVFQHRGPHPEQMPRSNNRENRVPSKGNFAPDQK